jgi:sugar/nucleoside kinase (ribokinase family)
VLVCSLGDLMLDVVVRPRAPLAPGADIRAESHVAPGGQAANVAAWAVRLGAEARFIGRRADDPASAVAAAGLEARGVRVLGPVTPGHGGVVVSLLDEEGERTMLSDRGVAPLLAPEEIDPAWLEGCAALHLSGYCLLRAPIHAAAERAAALARDAGARISLDLASWLDIRGQGPALIRERLAAVGPDVVLASRAELEALGDPRPAPALVLKRGADGCEVHGPGGTLSLPAPPATVVDTTGAGDALAAGVLVGGPGEAGVRLGLAAAAECVGRMGAMPAPPEWVPLP